MIFLDLSLLLSLYNKEEQDDIMPVPIPLQLLINKVFLPLFYLAESRNPIQIYNRYIAEGLGFRLLHFHKD